MRTDNLMFLRRSYPELLENIEAAEFSKDIAVEEARSGDKTLKIKDKDSYIYLHSKYNPEREAGAIIDKFEEIEVIDEDSHVVFYGAGLGYHIEIFKKRHPEVKYSIYEPSPRILDEFLKNRSLKELGFSSLSNLACEFNERSRYLFFDKLLKNKNERLVFLELPIYQRIFAEEYKEFFESFRKRVTDERRNLHTNYSFQKRWIINSMVNLKKVLRTSNILLEGKGKFKGKPAMLVSSGPSLNEEIENLRYIKENGLAYIFCAGSSVNTLIEYDIYPDGVISFDPGESNQKVFRKLKEKEIKNVPIIYGSTVAYEVLENYPGIAYHILTSQDSISNFFIRDEYQQKCGMVSDSSSVAIITLQLLIELGFENIYLVGQNLAYRGDLKHAKGIDYSSRLTKKELQHGTLVKDVYGTEALTNELLNSMRNEMELYININSNVNVVNTTKWGADIEGARFIELDKLIKNELTDKVVDKDLMVFDNTEYDKNYLGSQAKRMDIEYRRVEKLNKEYNRILNRIDKLLNEREFEKAENMYNKLDRQLERIENNDFYKTFIIPMNRVEYKILTESIDNLNNISNPYYKGKKIVKSFRNFIELCIKDLNTIKPIYINMIRNIKKYKTN